MSRKTPNKYVLVIGLALSRTAKKKREKKKIKIGDEYYMYFFISIYFKWFPQDKNKINN